MSDWSGGCLCGAVRYEANPVNPENWFCHCRMCQKWSGSVVSTDAILPKKDFRFTKGEPKYYLSSPGFERGFCRDCGSSLVFRAVEKDWISIQTGSLDDPEVAPPSGHYGIEGKISWLKTDDDLPLMQTEAEEHVPSLGD